jgi:uncharacterized protein
MSPYLRFCLIVILILPMCLETGCSFSQSQAESKQEVLQSETILTPATRVEKLGQELPITARVRMGGATIDLEVAKTPEEQSLGLMYRTELADNRGMIFIFDPPTMARFWMKNCLIPLDMVFVKGDRIKHIAENVPPCQEEPCPLYSADTFVDKVIELRAGRARELNLKKGDKIALEMDAN